MKNAASLVFKYRSYTPLPFVLVMFLFQEATVLSMISGFIIVLAGEFFRIWGVSYAGSETRTTGSVGGSYLVVTGAFAYVRNPLYLGNILIYIGVGIMSMAFFPYLQLLALIFFYIQYRIIIHEEEAYLKETFGKEFESYRKSVGRFIPRLFPYKNNIIEQPGYNLKAGLRSEKRTLQAISAVTLILIILTIAK